MTAPARTFNALGLLLISEIISNALAQAKRNGVQVAEDDDSARLVLARRVIEALEQGECDSERLMEIAFEVVRADRAEAVA